ncbi:MAG: RhuM family protein [Pseudomonadota bacterium]
MVRPVASPGKGQFLVYEAEDGQVKIDGRLEDETVWLTQQLMADLFQTTKQNIGQHLKNIFSEGELLEDSVVKKFFTTAGDKKKYKTSFYSLDAIISVGYRVKSHVATRFRIWATQRLREFIIKGFVLDDERLKNPDQPFDYSTNYSVAFRTYTPRSDGSIRKSPIFKPPASITTLRRRSASNFSKPFRIVTVHRRPFTVHRKRQFSRFLRIVETTRSRVVAKQEKARSSCGGFTKMPFFRSLRTTVNG